jgi:hypothetical protein
MLKEHTPVWVWDGYWWPAFVVLPLLDLDDDLMLVRFENGVTAPVKAAGVRYRELARRNEPSTAHSVPRRQGRRPGLKVSANVLAVPALVNQKSDRGVV